jgi:hypothetical protein
MGFGWLEHGMKDTKMGMGKTTYQYKDSFNLHFRVK